MRPLTLTDIVARAGKGQAAKNRVMAAFAFSLEDIAISVFLLSLSFEVRR